MSKYRKDVTSLYNSLKLYPPYQTENNESEGIVYQRWSTNDELETLIKRITAVDTDGVITYTQTFALDLWENRETADYIYILQ